MRNDVLIGVINNGPYEPTWFYDGKPYTYKVNLPTNKKTAITVVPYEVARQHWAVELTDKGVLRRATEPEKDGEEDLFSFRLGGLCPKVFVNDEGKRYTREDKVAGMTGHYDDNQEFKDWYTNGVAFKMKRIQTTMSVEEFNSAL